MIRNDEEFKQALNQLSLAQQRQIGAAFVRHVLPLGTEPVLQKIVAAAESSSQETNTDLNVVFKQAKAAILASHTRCGQEQNWQEQAGYFVARAASVLVAPEIYGQTPAWEAASHARMARTCQGIENANQSMHEESETQYRLLERFLAEGGATR